MKTFNLTELSSTRNTAYKKAAKSFDFLKAAKSIRTKETIK